MIAAKLSKLRGLAVVAAAGILHLLLLSAPVALSSGGFGHAKDPRTALFLVVASTWFIVESLTGPYEVRRAVKSHAPEGLPWIVGLSLLTIYWTSLTQAAASTPSALGAAAVAGTLLMGAGIGLRYLSLRALGVFFLNEVATIPGQRLVTTGIYGSMRHPSEVGTTCLAFGGAVLLGSAYGGLLCVVLLVPCLIWRTRLEDRVLCRRYGIEHDRYARTVPAFLPRIAGR